MIIKIKRFFGVKTWYKSLYDKTFVVRQENKTQYGVKYKGKIEGVMKHHCEVLEETNAKIKVDKKTKA